MVFLGSRPSVKQAADILDPLAFGHPLSIYDKDYRRWEIATGQAKNPGFQKTHIQFGTNDLNYMSTKQSDFVEHKDF